LVDAINIFLNNSYPLPFIFSIIEERLKYHTQNNIQHNIHVKEKFFTVLYIKSISESFLPIAYKCNYKVTIFNPKYIKKPYKNLIKTL